MSPQAPPGHRSAPVAVSVPLPGHVLLPQQGAAHGIELAGGDLEVGLVATSLRTDEWILNGFYYGFTICFCYGFRWFYYGFRWILLWF